MRWFGLLIGSVFYFPAWTSAQIDEQPSSAQPTMEVGVVLVAQVAADYRGSHHYRPYGLPLPYLLYQGPILKADRDGVRGDFWSNGRVEFNISVDGSLSGNSDDNEARRGMPDLESAVEFGPSLNVRLSGATFREGWSLRLPVRAVITIAEDGFDHIGNVFSPRLTWRDPDLRNGWRTSFSLGATVADRDYHAYFYDVDRPYVTPDRPFYHSGGGYSGGFMRFALYKPWEKWRFGVALRYDYLGEAEFADSPLVQTRHYGSVSLGLVRILWNRP